MAVSFACDGCGKSVGSPERMGAVQPGDYCPVCAEKVQTLYDDIDRLHDAVAKAWTEGLAEKIAKFRQKNPGFRVPDFES